MHSCSTGRKPSAGLHANPHDVADEEDRRLLHEDAVEDGVIHAAAAPAAPHSAAVRGRSAVWQRRREGEERASGALARHGLAPRSYKQAALALLPSGFRDLEREYCDLGPRYLRSSSY